VLADHLTKRFGDLLAVDDLSLSLDRGTVTGFLGPNGAGKTTTMRAVFGLVELDAGELLRAANRTDRARTPALS
jgi:ABC-2 type transport system ATP-binding protein